MLTAAEREEIYREEKIVPAEDLVWLPGANGRFTLKASVLRPSNNEELTLYGRFGPTYCNFALLCRGTPIRRFDRGTHKLPKPNGTKIKGPHKHPTPDADGPGCEQWAYPVSDIDSTDMNKALLDFLRECNIIIGGQYQYGIPF